MQSAQKYWRICARLQNILIHNLLPIEKDRKCEQAKSLGP